MAMHAPEPGSPVDLLRDAVGLVRAAERGTRSGLPPGQAAVVRTLGDDLRAAARALELRLADSAPPEPPEPPGPPGRGHLSVEPAGPGEVRLRGRGPAYDGDLVRDALHARARPARGWPDSAELLGARLWDAMVLLARDGLETPSALPTPLSLAGRPGTRSR